MVRQDRANAARRAHAGITILHVQLFGEGESIADIFEKILIRGSGKHSFAQSFRSDPQVIEDRFEPFKWFKRHDPFESLQAGFCGVAGQIFGHKKARQRDPVGQGRAGFFNPLGLD